ncbi:ABC transporter ATP-binding protein [Kosmotoga olearia]|uniref:ABC transporter related n=1 Tax=Kosmotoga olearia (strain ATCC BAA-1733 / DSM 21960 / TBF 19.5.1) TaxID=521045 RepID=C5CI80_KOSOT|nr:ABC transporter ATP-binding protein [Kosmotoga olearia]ACR80782.1 ABC transporter related [Kosmotoga olearia TBF 19.5.1]MDK2952735.1 ATP-binding cassette, subfamily multidrug efflux pump [Kosmotoga sp.]
MLKEFFKRYWWTYLLGSFFLIIVDLLQLIVPRVIGNIVDALKVGLNDISALKLSIISIFMIALGVFMARFFWRILIMGSARRFEYYSKKILFEKLLSLSPSFYDKTRVGDLMARFTNDVRAVRMAMGPAIVMIVDAIFLTSVTIIAMGTMVDWSLTWIAIIPLPFLAMVTSFFGKMIHNRFKSVQESFSDLTDTVEESVSGVRVIKSYGIEDLRYETLKKKSQDYVNKNMRLVRVWGMFFPLIQLLASIGYIIATFYGGRKVILGEITLGEFITFTAYLGMLIWPMMAIGWVINLIQRGRASYKRLLDILNRESEVISKDPVAAKKLQGHVIIRDLTYRYPGSERVVLDNISMEIKPGTKVAIVGTTGSGKSTIAKLIARLYQVPDGKIFIDGIDINKLPPETVRENISYVPQETFLFTDTIKGNIAFGIEDDEEERIVKYASVAAIHEDIVQFPKGYDTLVGERGVTLSGGQKQRVAIARALIKETPIVILDDCLSAVDTETEARILSSLVNSTEKKTIIIISHRLKAVRDANVIYVLHDGKIVGHGTHEELIESNELYRRMYERQLLEEKLEEE